MSRKGFYQVSAIVVFVTAILLFGFLIWRHTAKQNVLIGKEKAIQNAIQACNSVEQPTAVQAELTTFGNVMGYEWNPPEPVPAWFVKMKGRFMVIGGPVDLSNPKPIYWNECSIFIDAQTGEALSHPTIVE